MPLILKDRVKETTSTVGTGVVTLDGALPGFQSFSAVGDSQTYYTISNASDWEVGIGVYNTTTSVLTRDIVIDSSNGGSLVDWGAGVKDVFVTYPASKASITFPVGPKTANYTAGPNEGVLTDTTGGTFTVTLPSSPDVGMQVTIADAANNWATDNLTVDRNGQTIMGLSENLTLNISGNLVQFIFDGATWQVYSQIGGPGKDFVTVAESTATSIEYSIVFGGS
jgi:hypothetical protein